MSEMSETDRRDLRPVRVVSARALSPSVRALELELSDGAPFDYASGQYVDIYLSVAGGTTYRAYSIATPASEGKQRFEVAVTRVVGGPVSEALHRVDVGATFLIRGPTGFFTREPTRLSAALVCIGAGTGLAPLRAILREELASNRSIPVVLLFGCREPGDFLWGDEWRALEAAHPRFAVHVTLSRPPPAWTGLRGYVQLHAAALVRNVAPVDVYVCGLRKMVDEVRATLKRDAGLDRKSIHSERYD